MRLPVGTLDQISKLFLEKRDYDVLGCVSFEERSIAVPRAMYGPTCKSIRLLDVADPPDAFPSNVVEAKQKTDRHGTQLAAFGVEFQRSPMSLMAGEDALLDAVSPYQSAAGTTTLVLDITSLPKRFFCFFLRRLVTAPPLRDLVVTYTEPAAHGYAAGRLSDDPMPCDYLPGYSSSLVAGSDTLVVSLGFETISLRSLLEMHPERNRNLKVIIPFPPDGDTTGRLWGTLMEMVSWEADAVNDRNLEVVAAWDAEQVYRTLVRWSERADGLMLAPFGPKPHTLGMALFALKNDVGLVYTQPKSYNPNYSQGSGSTWVYVVKWDGVPCFDRLSRGI